MINLDCDYWDGQNLGFGSIFYNIFRSIKNKIAN